MQNIKAKIVDIFSSIQGEGIFVGARQVFVRFKECNIKCDFCDEPRDAEAREYDAAQLTSEIMSLDLAKGPHHSVSITGGEPLLYVDFLKVFLPLLRKNGFKVYLETNGTLPQALAEIIQDVDIIAMDFKLPSSTGQRTFWMEHRAFLKIAENVKVFVKAVVTPATTAADIEKTIELMKLCKKKVPLILQPATPVKESERGVASDVLLDFMEIGRKNAFENIQVIPQVHKLIGVK